MQPIGSLSAEQAGAKYALLFIGLTFISFFMFELLRAAGTPIQYALVGMGLAIFYLVLLALTEHLSVYLGSSHCRPGQCVALNSYHPSHVLGPKQGMGFATLLGLVLRPFCSGCCRPGRPALLLGALLLFRHPGACHGADSQARLVSGDGEQSLPPPHGRPPAIDQ